MRASCLCNPSNPRELTEKWLEQIEGNKWELVIKRVYKNQQLFHIAAKLIRKYEIKRSRQ